jgi:hypothetical protein
MNNTEDLLTLEYELELPHLRSMVLYELRNNPGLVRTIRMQSAMGALFFLFVTVIFCLGYQKSNSLVVYLPLLGLAGIGFFFCSGASCVSARSVFRSVVTTGRPEGNPCSAVNSLCWTSKESPSTPGAIPRNGFGAMRRIR